MCNESRPTADEVLSRLRVLRAVVVHAITSPPRDLLEEWRAQWSDEEQRSFVDDASEQHEQFLERIGTAGLWDSVSPWEKEFIETDMATMTEQQQIDGSWRMESVQVLLWALGMMDELPPLSEMADHEVLKEIGPRIREVIEEGAKLRPMDDINYARDMAEFWNWRSRTRQLIEEGRDLEPTPEMIADGIKTFDDIVRMAAREGQEKGDLETVDDDFAVFGKAYRKMDEEEWSQVSSVSVERHYALNWLCGYAPENEWDETPTDT